MLAGGADGATVGVCRTRRCDAADVVQTINASGTSANATAALRPGVWFWRLHGRVGTTTGTETGPVWEFTVQARDAARPGTGGSLFDFNGDGYGDIIVGSGRAGVVYVFAGTRTGISTAYTTAISSPASNLFGRSVANAGDVNGDGFADLIGGDETVDIGAGAAYVYLGGPTGLSASPALVYRNTTTSVNRIGRAVSAAGDINGDGYGDMLVGSASGNVALVLLGSSDLAPSAPIEIPRPSGAPGAFGAAVSSAGDVDADGYADVVIGSPDTGAADGVAFVFRGSPSGPILGAPTLLTGPAGAYFASAVSGAGDVNGDGYSDIVIGAQLIRQSTVFFGGPTGITTAGSTALTLQSITEQDLALSAISNGGDVDADGFDDLVVGSRAAIGNTGSVFLFRGGSAGPIPAGRIDGTDPANSGFGGAVGSAGDIDGDGKCDTIIGAPNASSDLGHAFVVLGSSTGFSVMRPAMLVGPDPNRAQFGVTVAGRVGM